MGDDNFVTEDIDPQKREKERDRVVHSAELSNSVIVVNMYKEDNVAGMVLDIYLRKVKIVDLPKDMDTF